MVFFATEMRVTYHWILKIAVALSVPLLFLVLFELGLRFSLTGTLYFSEESPHYRDELGTRLKPGYTAGGTVCTLTSTPHSYQLLPANKDLLSIIDQWKNALEAHAIPYRDITEHFNAENVLQYYGLGDYIHPNEKGHGLIARAALDLVNQLRRE